MKRFKVVLILISLLCLLVIFGYGVVIESNRITELESRIDLLESHQVKIEVATVAAAFHSLVIQINFPYVSQLGE